MKIINHFKPKIGIIENPQSSKLGKFIDTHGCFKGIENDTYYYNYDLNFSKKPTRFLSNIDLKLRKETLKSGFNKDKVHKGCYDERSSIPKKLLEHIMNKIEMTYNE